MRYICETLCNFATEKEQTHDATQKIRCPLGTRHISTETWGSLWKLCVSVFYRAFVSMPGKQRIYLPKKVKSKHSNKYIGYETRHDCNPGPGQP